MKKPERILFLILLTALYLTGCGGSEAVPSMPDEPTVAGTTIGEIALTIQSEVQQTAEWVGTNMPSSDRLNEDIEAEPTLADIIPANSGFSSRVGICPIPDGYEIHQRQGFCMSAPVDWAALNVDGWAASVLQTTPGMVLSLTPGWTESPDECLLAVFIVLRGSSFSYLTDKHQAMLLRDDIISISDIEIRPLNDIFIKGFSWESRTGEKGAVYAEQLNQSQMLHIGFQGTNCPEEQILPVLDTLRLN